MWAELGLVVNCSFRIATSGYEFECGEDQIDDIMEKLVKAAKRAEVTGDRSKAEYMRHENTHKLFLKVEMIKRGLLAQAEGDEQEAERRKLQERMAKKFGDLQE